MTIEMKKNNWSGSKSHVYNVILEWYTLKLVNGYEIGIGLPPQGSIITQ